jgi:hypothetical protein
MKHQHGPQCGCERIEKARSGRVAKPDSVVVRRIAEVWRAISLLYINSDVLLAIKAALDKRDVNAALSAIPRINEIKPRARQLIDIVVRELGKVYESTANTEYKRVGATMRIVLKAERNRFSEVPHSKQFLEQRAAELVVDISEEQRGNLRTLLARRYDANKRPDVIVRQIKSVIGLTERETQAVLNREDRLRESGMDEVRVQRETQRYSEKLHQARAERIARTEAVAVESDAKQTAWEVARDDGILPDDVQKEWIASLGACNDCADMDGQIVDLDEDFISEKYGRVQNPGLHPQCTCSVELRARRK